MAWADGETRVLASPDDAPDGWIIPADSDLEWSEDGARLFFGWRPLRPDELEKPDTAEADGAFDAYDTDAILARARCGRLALAGPDHQPGAEDPVATDQGPHVPRGPPHGRRHQRRPGRPRPPRGGRAPQRPGGAGPLGRALPARRDVDGRRRRRLRGGPGHGRAHLRGEGDPGPADACRPAAASWRTGTTGAGTCTTWPPARRATSPRTWACPSPTRTTTRRTPRAATAWVVGPRETPRP